MPSSVASSAYPTVSTDSPPRFLNIMALSLSVCSKTIFQGDIIMDVQDILNVHVSKNVGTYMINRHTSSSTNAVYQCINRRRKNELVIGVL
mmetsp:Transcript_12641/g.18912  ORF Transcript_12641/g.18912 Transcript_12641/m.18912 type:complete len:91 (+) Transcript_12641:1-273(+)